VDVGGGAGLQSIPLARDGYDVTILESRGDTPHSLGARLERHDVTPIAWYGVRLFTEGWSRTEPPVDPTALVLEVERQASCRDPYRLLSRCFHLIGMRR
jgi:hypothetical protein